MDEIPTKQKIRDFVHRISKHAPTFYIVIIIALVIFQFDIFKDNFPKEYIIDGIIVVATLMLSSIAVDKIISKNIQDPKPFLYCPECADAKMRTTGEWICENCHKVFGEPKKE